MVADSKSTGAGDISPPPDDSLYPPGRRHRPRHGHDRPQRLPTDENDHAKPHRHRRHAGCHANESGFGPAAPTRAEGGPGHDLRLAQATDGGSHWTSDQARPPHLTVVSDHDAGGLAAPSQWDGGTTALTAGCFQGAGRATRRSRDRARACAGAPVLTLPTSQSRLSRPSGKDLQSRRHATPRVPLPYV